MKKALFISLYDYANIFAEWCLCFENSIYKDKIDLKYFRTVNKIKDKYKYTNPKCTINYNDNNDNYENKIKFIINYIIKNDITTIFFEGSSKNHYVTIQRIIELSDKKRYFYIFHNGSAYRKFWQSLNKCDSNINVNKIIYGSDLYRLARSVSKDKKIVILPVKYMQTMYNVNDLRNKYDNVDKLTILHCPSSRSRKGSDTIQSLINKIIDSHNLHDKYEFLEVNGKSNEDIMDYKKKSHIYICQYNDDVGGFGVSAMEALATGNIVLSSMNNIERNVLHSDFPIINISGIDNFEKQLLGLLLKDTQSIYNLALKSLNYYHREYSTDNVSKKILKIIK